MRAGKCPDGLSGFLSFDGVQIIDGVNVVESINQGDPDAGPETGHGAIRVRMGLRSRPAHGFQKPGGN